MSEATLEDLILSEQGRVELLLNTLGIEKDSRKRKIKLATDLYYGIIWHNYLVGNHASEEDVAKEGVAQIVRSRDIIMLAAYRPIRKAAAGLAGFGGCLALGAGIYIVATGAMVRPDYSLWDGAKTMGLAGFVASLLWARAYHIRRSIKNTNKAIAMLSYLDNKEHWHKPVRRIKEYYKEEVLAAVA